MSFLNQILLWLKAFYLLFLTIRNNWLIVARYKAIGDVLWIEPVLRQLQSPSRNIVVVTAYPELFENYPAADIRFKNTNKKEYKRLVRLLKMSGLHRHLVDLNLAYENNPRMHFLHAYQQKAGVPKTNEYPVIYLSNDEKAAYEHSGRYAVIHIESLSAWDHRKIYGINWQRIINYLVFEKQYKVFVLSKEKVAFEHVENPAITLRGMISMLYHASLFIGIDSGPSHVAGCFKIPSILFFGSVNPWFRHFRDQFNGAMIMQSCEFLGCYHRESKKNDDYECLLKDKMSVPVCAIHSDERLLLEIDRLDDVSYRDAKKGIGSQ